jgi:hypothetical protein
MNHPDDDQIDGHAEADRLLELASGGDIEACLILAEALQAAELEDLAAELKVLCDPVQARRIAFLVDEERYPDD